MVVPPFILNVYKPPEMTSAQVVAFFRRRFERSYYGKVGHFGTLDPFAEGVLLLGFAGASRLSDHVHRCLPKTYRARGKWGEKTDTGDKTGKVIEKNSVVLPSVERREELMAWHFGEGEYWQKPPAFSSTKHKGRPLYQYAREGVFIQKQPVSRKIHFLGEFEWEREHLNFTCRVSSGTYIRVLFEDMAEVLGTVGHLSSLVRSGIGACNDQNALRREEWERPPEELISHGLSLDNILPLDGLYLEKWEANRFQSGAPVKVSDEAYRKNPAEASSQYCWVYGDAGQLLGLAQKGKDGPIVCFNLKY